MVGVCGDKVQDIVGLDFDLSCRFDDAICDHVPVSLRSNIELILTRHFVELVDGV